MTFKLIIVALFGLSSLQADAVDQQAEGRLTLNVADAQLKTTVIRDDIGITKDAKYKWNQLPQFSFSYVMSEDVVIPVTSGAIASEHPNWEWVLTPGTIEKSSKGEKLSLPFALMEKNENCLHNGFLSFDMKNGEISSKVYFQIASETCKYVKFDMWGELEASWATVSSDDAQVTLAGYENEEKSILPIRPIAELTDQYPFVSLEALAESGRIKAEDISHYGVLLDGNHYVSGCMTRMGAYPHCDQMVMPSYSFAKSLVASFALMRLEKLYPGTGQLEISDYVPECQGEAWQDVTFLDALNMTTGNYHDIYAGSDESSAAYQTLFLTKTHDEKINFSCDHFPHKEKPGARFSYHTSDTYVLGTALNVFWKKEKGADRDFFDDVIVKDIFEPLGLSVSASWTRRTYDRIAQPFTGWGLLLNRNDLAKLVWFMGKNNKSLQPENLFQAESYDAALQNMTMGQGLTAAQPTRPNATELMKYHRGFWAYNIAKKLNCAEATWLPYMSGYGGLSAVILPNKMGFYNVSDGGSHAFVNALYELNKIRSICEGEQG